MEELQWTLDDKLIWFLNHTRILKNPCERCLIENICREVCEQCDLYNNRCNVIRNDLFDVVEGVTGLFWVVMFSGIIALMLFCGT